VINAITLAMGLLEMLSIKTLTFMNKNIGNYKFHNPLADFNIDEAKKKLKELKAVNDMADQLEEFKKKLPNMNENSMSEEKRLDEYSKDDLQKLNDILKSIEKE